MHGKIKVHHVLGPVIDMQQSNNIRKSLYTNRAENKLGQSKNICLGFPTKNIFQ